MKNVFGPATTFHESVTLSFVIPSEAEGSAVPRTSPGEKYGITHNKVVIPTGA
jgi:hypothetical protein